METTLLAVMAGACLVGGVTLAAVWIVRYDQSACRELDTETPDRRPAERQVHRP
ncbi:hypothetical protein [Nocardiopsis dassonvillei]|uniref:hypothetical protein n=1 Tax=Nocardiopsis dassonvillei TaxID=2014 RepID=UPI003635781F